MFQTETNTDTSPDQDHTGLVLGLATKKITQKAGFYFHAAMW